MNNMMYVVGSGPSGIACAYTLLKAGYKVTLLDVGFTLKDESQSLVNRYRKDRDTAELIKDIHLLRKKHRQQSDVQPAKTLFGSDFPYKGIDDTFVENDDKAVIRSSLAKGGFSTVWGANVSCIIPKEMLGWPITFNELKPYYTLLEEIIDIASPKGEMSEIFPVNIGYPPSFPLGKQGNDLYESLKPYKDDLADDGLYFGRAKLAVGSKYSLDNKGCSPCGLCMHGCPNNAIFNSAFLLTQLQKDDNFTYLPGKLVTRFSEDNGEVEIHIKDIHSSDESILKGCRLFLACGVINTTCIVARSLNLTDHEFIIKDSQKYVFPLLRWHRSRGCVKEKEHTADQIYMEIDNPSVSPNIVHLQYYGYNDLMLEPLRQRLGSITELVPKLFSGFFERLMICFVYFHSDDSGAMSLKVHEYKPGTKGMGEIKGQINPKSDAIMKSILRLLKKHRHALGGIPLGLGVQTLLPGDSQHIGSTLPMSQSPNAYQTDLLGRPSGCERVHIVDSSVLPSIPATPLTLTVMANACRIADSVDKQTMEGPNV
ncbi:MAG: GMC family oxidoreductase [Nitrospiraceae bacterium]|nr:MAG: GMC family oxidoreductase [Nitrospiraceae bacterium]